MISVIRAGVRPKFLAFWGHQPPPGGGVGKGCFSQWWPSAFTVDGETYASAEHFMMAAKARLFGDAEMAARIRDAPHPRAAKELGRQVRGFDERRWAERRFDLVVAGNLAKFGQQKELRDFLVGTGGRVLVEVLLHTAMLRKWSAARARSWRHDCAGRSPSPRRSRLTP
ncbi:MAG TPA: NADAR family protein [Trebonia sp.]